MVTGVFSPWRPLGVVWGWVQKTRPRPSKGVTLVRLPPLLLGGPKQVSGSTSIRDVTPIYLVKLKTDCRV